MAIEKAEKEYEKYNLKVTNSLESDFDKAVKKIGKPPTTKSTPKKKK
jgi:hypothetical protein